MKNLKTSIVALSVIALALMGCQDDSDSARRDNAVTFSGSITGANVTRAANASWDKEDAIGIYMLTAGGTVAANSLELNKKYITAGGDGRFAAASAADAIYYPNNGSAVDFVAYYPYATAITDYSYPINVSDQSSQAAIDLLYSSNIKGMSKADATVANMEFNHKLSKIIMNATDATEEGLAGMTVTISGMYTSGSLNLSDGTLSADKSSLSDFEMKVSADGNTAEIEAIVFPMETTQDYSLTFSIPAGESTRTLSLEGVKFEAGKKYIYDLEITDKVKLRNRGTILDWTDVPSGNLEVDKGSFPQNIPLVYSVENTGAGFPLPPFPTADEAPSIPTLPNPFEWSDGSGVVTKFSDWKKRRAEIIAEVGHYEMGMKPGKPESLASTYSGNTLTVYMNNNGQSMTASFTVSKPAGEGPFPVVIGTAGSPSSSAFSNCILISLNSDQFSGNSRNDKFWALYPELANAGGNYMAWIWGVSRLIDALEQQKDQIGVDMEHIGIIGCSWAGKLALFAGAFDERIALTMAQESGGGGVNSWRISDQAVLDNIANGDTEQEVERINNTNYSWFMQSLKDNYMGRPDKLPYDHHEIVALIAPRAVLIYGNPSYVWMCDRSGYASALAAKEVWKSMGIEDRYGYDYSDGHFHCSMNPSQTEATGYFVDKFLRGIDAPTETVRKAPDAKYMYGKSADSYSWFSDWEGHTLR